MIFVKKESMKVAKFNCNIYHYSIRGDDMKWKKAAAVVFIGVLMMSGCSTNQKPVENTAYHKIEAKEAKEMMEKQDVIIVDVRRADEYAKGHIPEAILVPNETIKEKANEKLPDKDATYLVYCRSGNRSAQASRVLSELGYHNIYDFGGIQDWPYEIVGE